MTTTVNLWERVLAGDVRAASRLMRDIDDNVPAATGQLVPRPEGVQEMSMAPSFRRRTAS